MKKIILSALLLSLVAAPAFADELRDTLESCCNASLSANVIGFYFANSSSSTAHDATKYVISTAHPNGDKAYATGSDLAAIYVKSKDLSSPIVSGDILNTKPTDFTSAIIDILTADNYEAQ